LTKSKIKSGILVIEQKYSQLDWESKPGLQPTRIIKETRFPKKQQQIVVLCGTAYEYPFLLYVKFTN
jgi:hypothetical protein